MTKPEWKFSRANFSKFGHGVSENACEFLVFSIIWKKVLQKSVQK
jgi:hypothetical protein